MSGRTLSFGSGERVSMVRRGLVLEWITVAYNTLECVLSLVAGFLAGSVALVGFGFDSAIEVTSGAVLMWRLRLDAHDHLRERAEARALRIVGWCFLLLAVYVAYDAAMHVVIGEAPRHSVFGIAIAAASLVVMPLLARAKRRVAARIGSSALTADAKQTALCTYLSAILLGGLALNALLGWWWADPLAALVMVPIIAKEGIDALRGKTCCDGCA